MNPTETEYRNKIAELLSKCENVAILDLILQLLQKAK